MDVVIVSHVYRNANACVDSLANYGCMEENLLFMIKHQISYDRYWIMMLQGFFSPNVYFL